MKVAFCSAEVAPFAKVGGLADVAGSLPKALTEAGHEVIVFMPAYGMIIADPKWKAKLLRDDLLVRVNAFRLVRAKVWEIVHEGVKVWLIDGEGTFAKVAKSEAVYSPQRDDYLFFSRAVMEVCETLDWIPNVVSAHDWHMGFLPVVIRHRASEAWDKTATTFTIHNLAYQGEFGFDTLDAAGVDHELYNSHQLETYGGVNFLKAGCAFADEVNTVSPNYAQEIQTPEFGCRLEGLMVHLAGQGRLRGILNGIDVEVHNPESDPFLPAHFSASSLKGKSECRGDLLKKLGLSLNTDEPLLTVISRLSNQKGFDLMVESAKEILGQRCGWGVLGTGDPWAAEQLRALEAEFPGKVRFVEAFDAPLAQRIYAAGDIFLMPSSFEPCGLGQLFAMRYGNVPVVRRTGGLADTVHDETNGFVFGDRTASAFLEATTRAIKAFRTKEWAKFVSAGMTGDFSWTASGARYVKMFEEGIASRLAALPVAKGNSGVAPKPGKPGSSNRGTPRQ